MNPTSIVRWVAGALILFILIVAASSSTYTVQPGFRGVQVTLGKVAPDFKPEGFGFKLPYITTIIPQPIRQQTVKFEAECYSSDLQQVKCDLRVLYRVPQASVVKLFRDYDGDPFIALVEPRVAEALKEVTALRTADNIVQKRAEVKAQTLEIAKNKVGELLVIEDIVLEDISLTQQLESAIESKMVMEQEAAKSRFKQQQAQIEASTAVIKAKGEAQSIDLRGTALRENPSFIELQIVERWDGITPLVVGPRATGANMILPIGDMNSLVRQPETQ